MNLDSSKKLWFKLDNAAKIFPSIVSKNLTTLFRIAVYFKDNIKIDILQKSIENTIKRYPHFTVHLKKGFFWYYFEYDNKVPEIFPELKYPCRAIPIKKKDIYLFRIIAYYNRLAIETTHILTDGFGALTLLKSIIAEYLNLLYGPFTDFGDIIRPDTPFDKEELEDAFLKYYNKKAPVMPGLTNAFHQKEKLNYEGEYYIIKGTISIDDIKKKSKEYNCSINDLLVSLLFLSYLEYYKSIKSRSRLPIRLIVPINCRNLYKTKSLRNFTMLAYPEIYPILGDYSLEEIINYVSHFMKIENTPKSVQFDMARNVRSEKNFIIRLFPRFLKDFFLSFVFINTAEAIVTSSISNLGSVNLPDYLKNYIEEFDFTPAPGHHIKTSCGIIGYNDKINITFGRRIKEPVIERIFFSKLVSLGINVKIQSNI